MMGGRGAGTGSLGSASKWTDEDLGIGGIMDDADGTITERQLQYIRDLQRKLQDLADSGFHYERPGALPSETVFDKWREEAKRRFPAPRYYDEPAMRKAVDQRMAYEREQLEAWRRGEPAKARERSRRLRAINPERLSQQGASRFIGAAG
nr:MAG TPA: NADH dehydrogenase 1 beta subcomplex subunit 2 [Caudoviricetes sp.]